VKAKVSVVAIVGAGGLARAMARAWGAARELRVVVASRRPQAASALARGTRGVVAGRIEAAVGKAAVVLIAVPDRSITAVARELAPLRTSWSGVVVLHSAGAYGPELLRALASRGAATGVLHPLAVLASRAEMPPAGAFARIEGARAAKTAARRLARLAGLVPLAGSGLESPRARRAYHAAASLASNDLIALLSAARRLLVRHRVPERQAWDAVLALASSALSAAARGGAARALTGPVVRNDRETLLRQLDALRQDPEAREAHRSLSSILVEVAVDAGRLGRKDAAGLRRRLARGRPRSGTV
jgi:predicted short-subunit dehydrogenase-like oxidoreductase (DUF2520 family)